jgi:DNA-binding CsgD family transcriptional regulator/pimeloyl-ACP methyl ester carboxylesterase
VDPFDIHYVRTRSGRRVAVGVTGSGPIIVATPGSIATSNLRHSPYRHALIALRDQCTVVTYDHVGGGLSDREDWDYSPEGLLEEFEAVMASMPAHPAALFGSASGCQIVIRYAVEHPERVSCLGLIGGWARGIDYLSSPGFAAYRRAIGESWEVACEYFVAMQGRAFGPEAEELRALLRETTSHRALLDFIDAFEHADVTALLPMVQAPAFIPFEPNHNFYSVELTKSLAEGIPGARLQMFDEKVTAHRLFAGFVCELDAALSRVGAPEANENAHAGVLSAREREVLALVATGKSNRDIADSLVIAEATVTRHVHNILTKLGLSNRVEAATWWTRQSLSPGAAGAQLQRTL